MRYEGMLALRYLRSRRDERLISIISWSSGIGVAIGVAALIIVLSVMYGFDVELRDRILGFSAHVDVQGPGDTLEDWQPWLKQLQSLPEVAQAAPYATTQVMVTYGSRAAGAVLKGIDVGRETAVAEHMVSGSLADLEAGKTPFRLVMGKDLARKLGLQPGDTVNLLSPAAGIGPAGAAPRLRSFTLVGIFDSGFYEYDIGLMLAPLAAVQRLNRLGQAITGIELKLYDRDDAQRVADKVRALLPAAWVSDWMGRHRSFFRALRMERVVMGIILSLIVLVAVFNMVVSLVMMVMERKKEIAILKTVGATDASVMRVFLYMGGLLTGLGTLAGTGFGLLAAWRLDAILAWIEQVTGVTFVSGDVYYIDHVPSIIDPASVGVIVGASLAMGVLATFYPAWRAAKVPPADALRYE